MVSDKDYRELSQDIYRVDSLKEGDLAGNNNFKILKAEDNPDNGMQVRTVGAIKGGEVSKSHIMIVYVKSSYLLAS